MECVVAAFRRCETRVVVSASCLRFDAKLCRQLNVAKPERFTCFLYIVLLYSLKHCRVKNLRIMEEPVRKSFLDSLKHILKLANRYAFTTRIVFIAEYNCTMEEMQKKMKDNVKQLNEEYGELVITGLLILYPGCFVHLVETSEEILFRHIKKLQKISATMPLLIPLPAYYNLYKLYFSNWYSVIITSPPLLLDTIENKSLNEIQRQIERLLFKMYSLSEYLMITKSGSNEAFHGTLKVLSKAVPHFLPELTIVEYLLSVNSPALKDLNHYLIEFERLPYVNLYNDRIWPPPSGFVPHLKKREGD